MIEPGTITIEARMANWKPADGGDRDGWNVYRHGTFADWLPGVAGMPIREYLGNYPTPQEAKAVYPDGVVIGGSSYQAVFTAQMMPLWFDARQAGESGEPENGEG